MDKKWRIPDEGECGFIEDIETTKVLTFKQRSLDYEATLEAADGSEYQMWNRSKTSNDGYFTLRNSNGQYLTQDRWDLHKISIGDFTRAVVQGMRSHFFLSDLTLSCNLQPPLAPPLPTRTFDFLQFYRVLHTFVKTYKQLYCSIHILKSLWVMLSFFDS